MNGVVPGSIPRTLPRDPSTRRTPVPSRPRPPKRRGWRRLPVSIRVMLPLGLIAAIGYGSFDAWRATRAHLQLVDASGAPLELVAEVAGFVYESEPWGASPPRALGRWSSEADGSLTLGSRQIGVEALVRASAPGHGTGFALLRPGEGVAELRLGAPLVVSGKVATEDGRGVPGARVIVLGGGQRGVVLSETTTDADGGFTVDDVSDSVQGWTFRVLAERHAIEHFDWMAGPRAPEIDIRLRATLPARGRLVVTADGDDLPELGGLELRILRLPGLVTTTAADGSFEFLHLPPSPMRGPVVIPELPAGWTFRRTTVAAGETIELRIERATTLRGEVFSRTRGVRIGGAAVYHDHGPLGMETTRADDDGAFELTRLPHGIVDVFADCMVERRSLSAEALESKTRTKRVLLQGSTPVAVAPGVPLEPIEVKID